VPPHARHDPRYLAKVSGPLLDRIDLHIEVPAVWYEELRAKARGRPPLRFWSESKKAGEPQWFL
jgi:predicted ATPase with chaperone activity